VPDPLLAYATLFAWSVLAATVLPLGSEPALLGLVLRGYPAVPTVAIATAGNYLGACTTYWLGRRAAAVLEARGAGPVGESRAGRLLQRYGQPALLLSWTPIVGDALVAAAGAVRMPFLPFTIWVSIGKGARYAAVAWAALFLR